MTPIKRFEVHLGVPFEMPGVWALIDWKRFENTSHIQLICEVPASQRPPLMHVFILVNIRTDTVIPANFYRVGCRRGDYALYYSAR